MGSLIWVLFFFNQKNANKKVKGQVTKWENERMYLWRKALDPAYYKGPLQIKKRKIDGMEKCARILNKHFIKDIMSYEKDELSTIRRYHCILRMVRFKLIL